MNNKSILSALDQLKEKQWEDKDGFTELTPDEAEQLDGGVGDKNTGCPVYNTGCPPSVV